VCGMAFQIPRAIFGAPSFIVPTLCSVNIGSGLSVGRAACPVRPIDLYTRLIRVKRALTDYPQ
jgi:hypothetical protein